jgi:hypothetical protein
MLAEILKSLENEDNLKLFCGESHPNIYDAVSAISNQNDKKEIERALKNYFEQVMQITSQTSQVFFEAERMRTICESLFNSIQESTVPESTEKTQKAEVKTYNDEIVNFYLESIEHFASGLNEEVLYQHIDYLKNDYE